MLQVKNFGKFQHYRDRAPLWIKLYGSLLEDYEFSMLPDATKGHLVMLWLLASKTDNQIPNNPEWIQKRINATEPVDLPLLIRSGFLVDTASNGFHGLEQVASNLIQTPEQVAPNTRSIEKRREEKEKKREEQQQAAASDFAAAASIENEPHFSRFSFAEVRAFVERTKPHAENPGGLARTIWRSGEEDEQVAAWLMGKQERAEQIERLRQGALACPSDAFGPGFRLARTGQWGDVLNEIERQIGEAPTITWFEPLRFDAEAQTLIAPDPIFTEWIGSNYKEALRAALELAGLGELQIKTEEL